MKAVLRSNQRGYFDHGWLKSHHSFSFAEYHNPQMMGFRDLRVINEDVIVGGAGFPTHGHRDMEIITYVTQGVLEHRDSLGNSSLIKPGEVQRMSAGAGIRHSEFNHLKDADTKLLQIWILPEKLGLDAGYGQKSFTESLRQKNFILVASRDAREGSISLQQDVNLYVGKFESDKNIEFPIPLGRHVWLQVISGPLQVAGETLQSGDALAVSEEPVLQLQAKQGTEFLLFDLQ